MIDPESGFAPLEWQNAPGMTQVLVGYENGEDYTAEDWGKLYKFIMYLMDFWGEEPRLC